MAQTSAIDQQWYKRYHELNQEMNDAFRSQKNAFLRWSAMPRDPMPATANVDDLQLRFSRHMENAPDDEPDDEIEAQMRAERFAQEHRDSMGLTEGYSHAFRHTQTRQ